MSPARARRRAPRRRDARFKGALAVGAGACLAGVVALFLLGAFAGTSPAPAGAVAAAEAPTPQTDASVPASGVTMIGATPLEVPGGDETWGIGRDGEKTVLVRYLRQAGWSLGPPLPAGFAADASALAGALTPDGAGALLGTEEGSSEVVLVRKPGGAFEPTSAVPSEGPSLAAGEEPLLGSHEQLFTATRTPMLAALEEAGARAGALVAPVLEGAGVEHQVLHWDGARWSSEPIEIPAKSSGDFRVLALAASSPTNAWLLAQLSSSSSYPVGAVALFRRVAEGSGAATKWSWKPALSPGGEAGEASPLTVPLQSEGKAAPPAHFTVAGIGEPPTSKAQLLTVTSEGVWVDGERADLPAQATGSSTTIFYRPAGEGGEVAASWCQPREEQAPACTYELPEALPSGPARSIAWSGGGPYGQRVITGFEEGVSLSLHGEAFERVLALGGGASPQEDPGAFYGAAFSAPNEGWLGEGVMPVHLTAEPAGSRLSPWPTSFRHPLLAIAPQPGAPVGSLASEALAVGDLGAVARYKPQVGWLPESLFGVGQRVEHPRLRAVAWPTPTRAFAVGDYSSEYSNMWLWRAETGLWEPDPATPIDFRGNLLGVAFDPNDPARGYAVGSGVTAGSGGVLLRYGKTWTQEEALPPQAQGANFVSVAFAGSEAIVAYRKRLDDPAKTIVGGLIVNDGAGWSVDEQAASAMASAYPGAVAGLADGGAAFTAVGGSEAPRVFERESAASPWLAAPTPLPGLGAGSLAVFREAGALRAIVSAGGVANEGEPASPPPGFPAAFLPAFSTVGGGPQSGGVLRQTATGWSDEGHELNPAGVPAGNYEAHDIPYRPDPILAVMVDPTGTSGWAVGGNINNVNGRLETADIERYPADGTAPTGEHESPVAAEVPAHAAGEARDVTVAIGGGAQCAAPCADRARAGVGPDVWLQAALARAQKIGVPAFFYSGPYVTQGTVNGPRSQPLPFARELQSYAAILGSAPLPVYPAASPQELDARPEREGNESLLFKDLVEAGASWREGIPEPERAARQACSTQTACEADYYALEVPSASAPQRVRVIVLDDGLEVGPAQLAWLEGELRGAAAAGVPAIAVGNGDLDAQIAANPGGTAAKVAAALVAGGASAYFFDAPEQNVKEPLRAPGSQIYEFGSGTLGYVNADNEIYENFHGASGFLLAQVEMATYAKGVNAGSNRATVTPRLIPNISELALEAQGGTLLRRSSATLFQGLARRPRAGGEGAEHREESEVDPYVPIPSYCSGAGCETTYLFPEYTFSSSEPTIGGFVKRNLAVAKDPTAVLVNGRGEPEREPVRREGEAEIEGSKSGLFCAYNAGKTTVTISAGGLSASLPVTIEAGSVREPCGTVKLAHLPPSAQESPASAPPPAPAPSPAPSPAPASAPPPPIPLPPPPPAIPPSVPQPRPPAAALPAFVPLAALATPVLAFIPPPLPTPARPSPPSGTSAVTSPIEVAEREDEEESATESASAQAVAYRSIDHEPPVAYLLGAIALAAFAGASVSRPRRGRRGARVAPATISTLRSQRRWHSRLRRGRLR